MVAPSCSPATKCPSPPVGRFRQAADHITTSLELVYRHHPQIGQRAQLTESVPKSASGLARRAFSSFRMSSDVSAAQGVFMAASSDEKTDPRSCSVPP